MKVVGNFNVLGENNILRFNPNPANNLDYSGFISEELANNITAGQALYWDFTNNYWSPAKADSYDTLPCRAIALESCTGISTIKMLKFGTLKNTTWEFDNKDIYVSPTLAGALTTIEPTTSGHFVQFIGTAFGTNIGYFDFNPLCIQLA